MYKRSTGDLSQGMADEIDKCKVVRFGKSNHGTTCTVNGRALESVVEQKDLGDRYTIP